MLHIEQDRKAFADRKFYMRVRLLCNLWHTFSAPGTRCIVNVNTSLSECILLIAILALVRVGNLFGTYVGIWLPLILKTIGVYIILAIPFAIILTCRVFLENTVQICPVLRCRCCYRQSIRLRAHVSAGANRQARDRDSAARDGRRW